MEQQVVFLDALAQFNDLGFHAVEADTLVTILAKDERLAVLEFNDVVSPGPALGRLIPGTIIENVAVLVDLDERCSAMLGGSFKSGAEMLDVDIDGARHE